MSIINDALKKAQTKLSEQNQKDPKSTGSAISTDPAFLKAQAAQAQTPLATAEKPAKKPFPAKFALISVFIVIAISAAALFFIQKPKGDKRSTAPSKFIESSLEVVGAQTQAPAAPASPQPTAPTPAPVEPSVKAETPAAAVRPNLPNLTLNGIFYSEINAYAIINGKIVNVGDSVAGAKVEQITENNVKLKFYDLDLLLKLK